MKRSEAIPYVILEDYVSLIVAGSIRNISKSAAKKLIEYYAKQKMLVDAFVTTRDFMWLVGSDESKEATNEMIRLFDFLCLIVEMHNNRFDVSETLGYNLKRVPLPDGSMSYQLVEVRYNQEVSLDDEGITDDFR